MEVKGVRRDIDDSDWTTAKVWDYGKESYVEGDWEWYGCVPDNSADGLAFAKLSKHTVVEHEDGTITVSPSILVNRGSQFTEWHGYLERGIWREV